MEIIDSHTHWGPSITLGTEVTTEELLRQAGESDVQRIVIFPFPSTAIEDERINDKVLELGKRNGKFIPYYYMKLNGQGWFPICDPFEWALVERKK